MFRSSAARRTAFAVSPTAPPPIFDMKYYTEHIVNRPGHSPLVKDFFTWCIENQRMQFHAPITVALRQTGLRGIYLDAGATMVPRNTPLFTVPFSAFLTPGNIQSKLPTKANIPKVTEKDIVPLIRHKEMEHMARHLVLAHAFALATWHYTKQDDPAMFRRSAAVPSMDGPTDAFSRTARQLGEKAGISIEGQGSVKPADASVDPAERRKYGQPVTYSGEVDPETGFPVWYIHPDEGFMPYLRLVDDEYFDENGLFKLYQGGLDTMQMHSYTEIFSMFGHTITDIHAELGMRCSVEHFRRTTRILVARAEHLSTGEYYSQRTHDNPVKRLWRKITKAKPPRDLYLTPMVDLMNHSNKPNATFRVGLASHMNNEPAITVVALTDIYPGQEICRYYNFSMDRAAAFFRYGFLPYDLNLSQEPDSWEVHFKGEFLPNMHSISDEDRQRSMKVQAEVERLNGIFKGHSASPNKKA